MVEKNLPREGHEIGTTCLNIYITKKKRRSLFLCHFMGFEKSHMLTTDNYFFLYMCIIRTYILSTELS